MRATREDTPFVHEQRPRNYVPVVVAAAVLVLAIPLYYVLRDDPAEQPAEPVQMPVVRDSAVTAPPVVNTTPQQQAATQTAVTNDFPERRLAPQVPIVGAGTAEVVERESEEEGIVIDGPLLEELEADAAQDAAADR